MAIATGTAIALAAAASAGTQIYGAHKASSSADKASATEAESADKALEFSKGVYDQRYRDLAPYRQQAAASLGKFSELLGIAPPPMNAAPMATDRNHIQSGQSFPASWVPGSPLSGTPQTAPGNGSPVGTPTRTPPPVADSYAVVQTPNGQRVRVPQGELVQAIARGGRVLS